MQDQASERIDGRLAYREAVERLMSMATRSVALYSPRLPAFSYASDATIEALKTWLLGSTQAAMQILVHEPRYAVAEPNRLINLGLRLTSSVSFRDAPSRLDPLGDMLIVDGRHLLQRPQSDSTVAMLWLDNPLKARDALKQFTKLWDESTTSIEIRNRTL